MCKLAYYRIRAFRHIRICLSDGDARHIATAMVMCARLDYCNVLSPVQNIAVEQRDLNMLGCIVTHSWRRDHITPILKDLYYTCR
jgi:hypothetical protein